MGKWIFVAALLAATTMAGCRHGPARTVLDSAGPADFDPSLPRVALPSLAAIEGAGLGRSKTAAPLLTTALDGHRARFEVLKIRSVVDGPVALTEIHVGVRNTEIARTVETTFAVNLPPGGAITRFAMRAGGEKGEWQEGRIAEATSARRAYERLVQRGIDPGLVEIDGVDRVRVRLFPMLANEKRDVALTVLHTLPHSDEPFRLPLAGVAVSSVDAQVLVTTTTGKKVATFTTRGPPADDLVLPLRADFGFATAPAAFNSDGALVARVALPGLPGVPVPVSGTHAPPPPTASGSVSAPSSSSSSSVQRVIVAFDTSASRSSILKQAAERLRLLAIEMGTLPLEVACFDQDVEPLFKGAARGFDVAQTDRIAKRGALGASDLGKALAWVAKTLAADAGGGKTPTRVLLFTDSTHTFGPRSRAELAPLVHQIRGAGAQRIDVIPEGDRVEGGLATLSDLGVMVQQALSLSSPTISPASPTSPAAPSAALAARGGLSSKELWARITSAPRPASTLKAAQAKWHWPRQIDLGSSISVGAGASASPDEVVVFTEVVDPKTLAFSIDETHIATPTPRIGPSPLVSLAISYGKLRELQGRLERAADAPAAYDLRREIMRASLAAGILTSETAFVILEGEEDYEQAQIKQGAEGRKVVTVSRGGAREGRTRPAPPSTARGATSSDRDSDGIPDQVDKCPEEYEDDDEFNDDDGCPEPEDVVHVINGRPGLLRQPIRFPQGSTDAASQAPNRALLIEIAAALRQSPRVGLLEVGGHSRLLASPEEAMKLADARAASVRSFLVKNGVSADRVVARTYGSAKPLKPNDGNMASENDRVEIVVLVVDGKRKEGVSPLPAPPPHSGHYGEIAALASDKPGDGKAAVRATEWYASAFDPLAFLVLGDALASSGSSGASGASGDRARAARAYGSFADVFPERPTHWRMAAGFLDRLVALSPNDEATASLAIAAYERASVERPTYFASRRGLAYALARAGRYEEAFAASLAALRDVTPSREGPLGDERRGELAALLRTDAALLGAAWARVDPPKRESIEQRLVEAGAPIARVPSMHVVLTWENDATNVDISFTDARGGIASPQPPHTRVLRSGGEYRLDVRTGYGPDWFAIDGRPTGFPYRLSVRYAARGAMGPAIGKVSIVEHDGAGRLAFDDRPFVLMNDQATLDLGVLASPLASRRDAAPVAAAKKAR